MTTLHKIWSRPSLVIFTENQPSPLNAIDGIWDIGATAGSDYIFLTDDNRSDLSIATDRIDYKTRMINGRMRSYHVADKKTFSTAWRDVPSDASEISENRVTQNNAWAAGKEMLKWYEDHPNSFYLMLVYDTPNPEGVSPSSIPVRYKVEVYNVFMETFTYVVKTRGITHDLWDVSMSLVEA